MTSGRIPCSDCGRNSPQGRHASCRVLSLLQNGRTNGVWSKVDLMRAVYPDRWAQHVPGEWPDVKPIDGCISTLRKQGHMVAGMNRHVWLKGGAS